MERLIEGVSKRSVLVLMMILLIMLWGGISAYQMQRDYMPAINNSTLMITVRAENFDANQVKSDIASIVEQAGRRIDGLQYLETNSYDGGLFASLYFPLNFDVQKAEQEIIQALNSYQFPAGVEKPVVTRVSTHSFPMMRIGLVSEGTTTDEKQLRTEIQTKVAKELEYVSGVKEVRLTGTGKNGYVVTVHMNELKKNGLTLKDVEKALSSANTVWPKGKIQSQQALIPIQVTGETIKPKLLKQIKISNAEGKSVDLSSVADVSEGMVDLKTISRTDGKPSVLIDVMKTPSSNVTDVSDRIKQRVNEVQAKLPEDVQMNILYDYGAQVQKSLFGLLKEGVFGSLFAMVCVFVFLRHVRATLLIALTLPICFLVTTGFLKAMDITLNMLTVSGLVVAMGRVVDDSIVILDNIYRRVKEAGRKATIPVIAGAVREMIPAIVSSTATTVAVFIPIALVGGMISAAFSTFAWSVVIALVTSLVVSLVVIPGLSLFWLNKGSLKGDSKRMENIVHRMLSWALRRKKTVTAVCAGVFSVTVAAALLLPTNVLPMGRSGEINIEVELPENSSLSQVNAEVKKIEDVLGKEPAIDTFSATIGSNFLPQFDDVFDEGGGWIPRNNVANITVTVKEGTDVEAYSAILTKKVKAIPSKALFTVTNMNIAGDDSRLKVVLTGADTATLEQQARVIQSKLKLVQGLSVEGAADNDDSNSIYLLNINRDQLQRTGIKMEDVLERIKPYLSQGEKLSVQINSGEVPIVLENDAVTSAEAVPVAADGIFLPGQNVIDALANEIFTAADGSVVALNKLATLQHNFRNPVIRERDGRPFAVVSADVISRNVGEVTDQVDYILKDVQMPPGVTYTFGGISEQVKQMVVEAAIALGVSTLLVLLIISTFFRGWKVPVSVLVCIPLALIGSVWGLILFGKEWNLSAFVGLLMLTGIVVTNGIVLVDKIERNLREGMIPRDAVLQGTMTRIRPVLMTAGTTILTVLPLCFTSGGDTIVTQTLGIVVVGGMLTSTCISLFIIPIIYEWMNRKSALDSGKIVEVEQVM
ncbi:efflux RND transporter permease subunit [Neobacillus drentensis]|uniref:efflux RND transporter permease subunit n=1 Tax=Neobacillus drentensis TaxID=220684 RepID=UPI002FFFA66D